MISFRAQTSFALACVYAVICAGLVVLMLTAPAWGEWIDSLGDEPEAKRECPK